MKVNFVTPTILSLIDIISMGDSSKRDDSSKIGTYDSGLKYSIALLLRNSVDIKIETISEDSSEEFTFGTFIKTCDTTGKTKELISVKHVKDGLLNIVETGFAKALGYNWELWMALRELWSNMLDENGQVLEGDIVKGYGTTITLEFDTYSDFFSVWEDKNLYINQKEPLYQISNYVDALENKERYLRIYKQNILVYQDKKIPSLYAYNIRFGEIDERRILSNLYSVETKIVSAIEYTSNRKFLKTIITKDFETSKDEFLSRCTIYGESSSLIHEVAFEVYNETGSVSSYDWLINSIKKRKDCKIGGKIIKSVEDSLWSYSNNVIVQTVPEIKEELEIQDKIRNLYNIDINVDIKEASLKGSNVIADKHENCIIVDNNFDPEKDMQQFIVQYLDLTVEGNVIDALGNYIVNLIKK